MPWICVVGVAAIGCVLVATADYDDPLKIPACYSTVLDRITISITLKFDDESIFPWLTCRSNRGQILLRARVNNLVRGSEDQHIRCQE
jgi:hypothetical protein